MFLVFQGLKKAKAAVGTGYSNDEIDAEGKADLKVLSEMLADKEFFFGDEPHSLDLVTFAHLAQVRTQNQFYSVDFSQSRIGVKRVRFQQTHNQGLRQLFQTGSWDLRA